MHDKNERTWSDADVALGRIMELSFLLQKDMQQFAAVSGLTTARSHLMWEVYQNGPQTQRALSETLGVSPRNVTGLVDALEADGFVARTRHPTDRRAILVTLTDRGRETAASMDAGEKEFARQLFGDVPDDELGAFVSTLERVIEKLRAAIAPGHGP